MGIYLRRVEQLEEAIARIKLRLQPAPSRSSIAPLRRLTTSSGSSRSSAMDLCYPVASLLARGKLEEAAALVSDRAWVASTPLYG